MRLSIIAQSDKKIGRVNFTNRQRGNFYHWIPDLKSNLWYLPRIFRVFYEQSQFHFVVSLSNYRWKLSINRFHDESNFSNSNIQIFSNIFQCNELIKNRNFPINFFKKIFNSVRINLNQFFVKKKIDLARRRKKRRRLLPAASLYYLMTSRKQELRKIAAGKREGFTAPVKA